MSSKHIEQLRAGRKAATELRNLPSETKNKVLKEVARLLLECKNEILKANAEDLKKLSADATPAFRDRLMLSEARIADMCESLNQVAALKDPVNEVVDTRTLANGLQLKRVRAPMGVIFMIFESRPNIALEAFSMAFKSGNVIYLRGGKESMLTTGALYGVIRAALAAHHAPAGALWGITDPDRALMSELLLENKWIDLVVPRGGDALIKFVDENSSIPVIKNDRGLCHVYVHEDADIDMAIEIVVNSKTQRPGVCNAMETLLVHRAVKDAFLPKLYERLHSLKVEWHVCPETLKVLRGKSDVHVANGANWDTEYLDLKMNAKVVGSLDDALAHIEAHGSRHSEAIVTQSEPMARRFQNEVDAAAVYWNASTRFTDGFEFGLGGELGISTQKLHVRGPVGLRELTSPRWIIDGRGQTRK